ncbi:MAG TPA: hypothetical protein VN711_04130, partial [Candidatus Saccharimonadales bacterium]|nr:hypothetical protein [Candidatus Saccharimonadales bacterium]
SAVSITAAHAQETLSMRDLTVIPPTVTVNVDPGGKSEGIIKLINDGSDPLTLHVDTQDFIVTDPHGVPTLLPPNTYSAKYSAATWVGVAPSTFTIAPHQKAELNYYIQVPKDARPGGHYTAVIFKPAQNAATNTTGASVQTQIGTLFSVHVNGNILEKANVVQFLANTFQEYGPVKISTQIKNMGDSDITPQGTITLTDMFGNRVAAAYLDKNRIFPEAVRDYENSFGQHWMFGRYTATFLASYGAKNNLPLEASITFIVFPWKVTLVVILLLIAIVLGVMVWKKRKNQTPKTPEEPTTSVGAAMTLPQEPTTPSSLG